MPFTETKEEILKKAVQEVSSFLYWEVPMKFYWMWEKILPEIDKAIEELRNEEKN